jgi:hypothetical protein
MRLQLKPILNKIIHQYSLKVLVNEQGWVYVKIQMGMYGLTQASILANKLLIQQLNAKGYYHCQHTPGLWRHVWHDISFCFMVDGFGIKSASCNHVLHLKTTLEDHYTTTMDWDGSLFCSINIDWNYPASTVNLNMPNYIPKAHLKFQHSAPSSPQNQPYKHAPIQYNSQVQRVDINTSCPLSPDAIKCIHDIVGTFLYYGRAVNPTLLAALSSIAACQANSTTAVAESYQQLFDYIATHPNAGICCYKACNMILAVHTKVSYLLEQNSKSNTSAHFYLTNHNDKEFNKGIILTLSSIIKHVMSSASKVELAALYYGANLPSSFAQLSEMGHPQLKHTMITTDNITAQSLTMGTMTPKASKSMDQCFYWLKHRNAQRQFLYLWHHGIDN